MPSSSSVLNGATFCLKLNLTIVNRKVLLVSTDLNMLQTHHSSPLPRSMMATKADALNPRTTEYQFFGPPGALLVTISSPLIAYALYFGCSEESGGCPPGNLAAWIPSVTSSITRLDWWMSLWDAEATVIYLAWYLFCVVAWAILPGNDFQGVLMRNGQKKTYKVNGISYTFFSMYSQSYSKSLFVCRFCDFHLRNRHCCCDDCISGCRILHVPLPEMGWFRHSISPPVGNPSRIRLPRVIPTGEAAQPWRKHWKPNLRCMTYPIGCCHP